MQFCSLKSDLLLMWWWCGRRQIWR